MSHIRRISHLLGSCQQRFHTTLSSSSNFLYWVSFLHDFCYQSWILIACVEAGSRDLHGEEESAMMCGWGRLSLLEAIDKWSNLENIQLRSSSSAPDIHLQILVRQLLPRIARRQSIRCLELDSQFSTGSGPNHDWNEDELSNLRLFRRLHSFGLSNPGRTMLNILPGWLESLPSPLTRFSLTVSLSLFF
jgi:hypothetical protein